MRCLRLIYDSVPGWFRWLIVAGAVSPILKHVAVQFLTGKPVQFDRTNLSWFLLIFGVVLTAGFVVGAVRARSGIEAACSDAKQKRSLPYRQVSVGTYSGQHFDVDVQADIVLGEQVPPSPDVFLKRVHHCDPYCRTCGATARVKRASWMADGRPIGYECRECGWVENLAPPDLSHNVDGFVRRTFASIWESYSKQVFELTGGHPDDYTLPSC